MLLFGPVFFTGIKRGCNSIFLFGASRGCLTICGAMICSGINLSISMIWSTSFSFFAIRRLPDSVEETYSNIFLDIPRTFDQTFTGGLTLTVTRLGSGVVEDSAGTDSTSIYKEDIVNTSTYELYFISIVYFFM